MKKNKVINLFGDKNSAQNKGVKYSILLEQFMTPFSKDFSHMEYIEDIFDISIAAWNFANMCIIMEDEDIKDKITSDSKPEVDTVLLNKMIDYKIANFKEYTKFIIDYELEQTDGDPKLIVVTQEEEAYLAVGLGNFENPDASGDFEENFINRNAIVLEIQAPFIDWHNNIFPENPIGTTGNNETNIYLVNDNISDLDNYLRKKFDLFFTLELEERHDNKKEWPQKRNYKMFKQWFKISTSTTIYDLEKKAIFKLV